MGKYARTRGRTKTPRPPEEPDPPPRDAVLVNRDALAPLNTYGEPKFVKRGYYVDEPFTCKKCGVFEIWTATQQKWWYEVAKGFRYSTAIHCRACRKLERERREAARRTYFEGIERKKKSRAT